MPPRFWKVHAIWRMGSRIVLPAPPVKTRFFNQKMEVNETMQILKPPRHLRPVTKRWWSSVVAEFELESHHLRLLSLAAEAWDRGEQAKEVLAAQGLTFTDRFGQPRARPEVAIERDSRTSFARMLRELALDTEPPGAGPRPPGIKR